VKPPTGRRPAHPASPLPAGTTGAARRRLLEAQTRRLERQNALADGDVLPVADVTAVWSEILLVVRQRLLSLPASLAETLAAEHDPRRVYERLEHAVRDCLQALSEWHPPGAPPAEPMNGTDQRTKGRTL
jgi:hypothetical protein